MFFLREKESALILLYWSFFFLKKDIDLLDFCLSLPVVSKIFCFRLEAEIVRWLRARGVFGDFDTEKLSERRLPLIEKFLGSEDWLMVGFSMLNSPKKALDGSSLDLFIVFCLGWKHFWVLNSR